MTRRGRGLPLAVADRMAHPEEYEQLVKLLPLEGTRKEIRESIMELERQKPSTVEEYEHREAEIQRLRELLPY